MVIILSDIHVRGNDILIKEWDYNCVMRGEGMNVLEKLFKEYLGEDLELIKMKQIIYDTYVIFYLLYKYSFKTVYSCHFHH